MKSLFTFKSSKVPCPKHPSQNLRFLCLERGCSSPYVCIRCEAKHPKDHSWAFQSLDSVLDDKYVAQYAKILERDFSLQNIGLMKDKMLITLQDLKNKLMNTISETVGMIGKSFEGLQAEVEKRRDSLRTFELLKNNRADAADDKHLKRLVESYQILKRGYNESLDLNLDGLISNFKKATGAVIEKVQTELLSSLKTGLKFEAPDFSKLKVKEMIRIPQGGGVEYEALAHIAKWNLIAFGCEDNNRRVYLGLYDLDAKRLKSSICDVRNDTINNVLWIDHKNYILTGSSDSNIRIFRASDYGRVLQAVHTFRGHTYSVRYIKYIPQENVLVSIGHDVNIKLWNIDNFKRCGAISTGVNGDMSGSIAHIKVDRLIGVPFQSGYIRFYHLGNKRLVFQLHVGAFYNMSLYGLQYLSHRRMIVTNTPNAELKMWQYTEGERLVGLESTVSTQSVPYCIVANSDESELIYFVHQVRGQCLETYSFHTNKTCIIHLPKEIEVSNCLIPLGLRALVAGDSASSNICILDSRTSKI